VCVASANTLLNVAKLTMDKELVIVKVQKSLFSSDGTCTVLIYDETRKHTLQMECPSELAEYMGDEPKMYFEALVPTKGAGFIELQGQVDEQDW